MVSNRTDKNLQYIHVNVSHTGKHRSKGTKTIRKNKIHKITHTS